MSTRRASGGWPTRGGEAHHGRDQPRSCAEAQSWSCWLRMRAAGEARRRGHLDDQPSVAVRSNVSSTKSLAEQHTARTAARQRCCRASTGSSWGARARLVAGRGRAAPDHAWRRLKCRSRPYECVTQYISLRGPEMGKRARTAGRNSEIQAEHSGGEMGVQGANIWRILKQMRGGVEKHRFFYENSRGVHR